MKITDGFGICRFGLSVMVSAMLGACGGGSVSSAPPGTAPPVAAGPTPPVAAVTTPPAASEATPPAASDPTGPTVQGSVIAGPVEGSNMEFFEVDADGKNSDKLGSGLTDSSGSYRITLSRPIKAGKGLRGIAKGGSYASEADTKAGRKTLGTLETLIPSPPAGAALSVNVTPLTHFASVRATELAGSGKKTLIDALVDAEGTVKKWLAVDGGASLGALLPGFTLDASDAAKLYGLVLGALEQLAKNLGKTPAEIYAALACDIADGILDGKGSAGVSCGIGSGAGLDTLGTTELIRAINTYIASTTTIHADNKLDAAPLAAPTRTSVVAVSPASSGAAVGSTGAISFMRLAGSGKEVVLVAAREQGLIMVDMSDPSLPVVNRLDALNALIKPLMTSVGGVIPIPGATSSQAMLYSYSSKKVITVDLDTNAILKSGDLALTKQASFSGASGVYVAGGVPDTGRGVIWLATSEGYKAIVPSTLSVISESAMAQAVPENMGGDPTRGMLFAPNYGTLNGGAVDWVDLSGASPVTYAMSGADWTSYSKSTIGIADSGSVDSIYNVGLIIGEDISSVLAVNLDKSAYDFNATAKTFKAKDANSSVATSISAMTLAGSSVDSVSHFALLMAGYSNSVVVAKIDNPAAPKTGTWTGIEDWRGFNLSGSDYSYAADPHAVGAFNIKGKPYGFLLNGISGGSTQKVMLVDMDAFYKAAAGTSKVLTSNPVGTTVKPLTWVTRP